MKLNQFMFLLIADVIHILLSIYVLHTMTSVHYSESFVVLILWAVLIVITVLALKTYPLKSRGIVEKGLFGISIIILIFATVCYGCFLLLMRFDYEIVNGLFHAK